MARYKIFVFCGCGDVHPMGTSVELNDDPVGVGASAGQGYSADGFPL
jgi:hypothetical protein